MLALAFEAGKTAGTMPAVMNAANEEAVAAFLQERISFLQIEEIVERAMQQHAAVQTPSLEAIMEADAEGRTFVRSFLT